MEVPVLLIELRTSFSIKVSVIYSRESSSERLSGARSQSLMQVIDGVRVFLLGMVFITKGLKALPVHALASG
jgi:hypothetical protein